MNVLIFFFTRFFLYYVLLFRYPTSTWRYDFVLNASVLVLVSGYDSLTVIG